MAFSSVSLELSEVRVTLEGRSVRLARVQALAEEVFGDAEKADKWLRQGLGVLNGQTPLEFARTEAGGQSVEEIPGKIDWGASA